jgi:hypothetical protein
MTSLLMLVVVLIFGAVSVVGSAYMRVSRKADITSCTSLFGLAAVTVVTDRFNLHGKDYDLTGGTLQPSQTPLCMIPAISYNGPLSKGTFPDGAGRAYVAVLADDVGKIFSISSAVLEATQAAMLQRQPQQQPTSTDLLLQQEPTPPQQQYYFP